MEASSPIPKSVTLSNGAQMPLVGLGTADSSYSKHLVESITNAVMKVGYCHIDTASVYGNEEVIGEALQECFKQGKSRSDVFIVTKMWWK